MGPTCYLTGWAETPPFRLASWRCGRSQTRSTCHRIVSFPRSVGSTGLRGVRSTSCKRSCGNCCCLVPLPHSPCASGPDIKGTPRGHAVLPRCRPRGVGVCIPRHAAALGCQPAFDSGSPDVVTSTRLGAATANPSSHGACLGVRVETPLAPPTACHLIEYQRVRAQVRSSGCLWPGSCLLSSRPC